MGDYLKLRKGIGRSCALQCAREGAKVVVSECVDVFSQFHMYSYNPHSLDEAKAQKVVEEIKAAGGDAIAVGGDVGAEDSPEKILKATIGYGNTSTRCYTVS